MKKKNKEVTPKAKNVFKDKPKKGTVIAVLTPEEQAENVRTWEHIQAIELADNVPFAQIQKAVEEKNRCWMNICKKHNIPYAWNITADPVTGEVYLLS